MKDSCGSWIKETSPLMQDKIATNRKKAFSLAWASIGPRMAIQIVCQLAANVCGVWCQRTWLKRRASGKGFKHNVNIRSIYSE